MFLKQVLRLHESSSKNILADSTRVSTFSVKLKQGEKYHFDNLCILSQVVFRKNSKPSFLARFQLGKVTEKSQIETVTVRSRTGLRMQESWLWAWTWVHRKTHEKVFWLLTRTLTRLK